MNLRFFLALALPMTGFLAGCASNSAPLKAKPAAPSAFLEDASLMKPRPERVPFQLVWEAADLGQTAERFHGIYISPVSTQYLRPIARPLTQAVEGPFAKGRPVAETAGLLRSSFQEAFGRSPQPRLQAAAAPGPGTLRLDLALIELNPTNVVGNVVKYGAPGGSALAPFTKGNIAIEGKVRESSGRLVFEFADNEQDAFAVVSVRDLSSYGHARAAIHEWAKEFEELTRTAPTHKVAAPSAIQINPL